MRGNDWDWAAPAAAFVAVQFAIGAGLAAALGFEARPPILNYLYAGSLFGAVAALGFLFHWMFKAMMRKQDRPIKALIHGALNHKKEIIAAFVGVYLVALQMAALTWLKNMMPSVVPFWADPMLADLDQAIFLGTDPWRLVHPLPRPLHVLVDTVYISWFAVKAFVIASVLAFAPSMFKSRAMLAYFLTIGIFGVLGQYGLSSAGPIFYAEMGFGNRFADLPVSHFTGEAKDYLWAVYSSSGESLGSGISAMPSVHVALAAWIALTLQSLWRRLALIGWTFYAFIMFGSVYLGWHYFSDGVVGTVAALLAWKLSSFVLEREWKLLAPRPRLSAEPAN